MSASQSGLPELPEPALFAPQMITEDAFTADQMRAIYKQGCNDAIESLSRGEGRTVACQRRICGDSGKWLAWEEYNGEGRPEKVGRWSAEYRDLYTHPTQGDNAVQVTDEMVERAFVSMRKFDCFFVFDNEQLRRLIRKWLMAALSQPAVKGEKKDA